MKKNNKIMYRILLVALAALLLLDFNYGSVNVKQGPTNAGYDEVEGISPSADLSVDAVEAPVAADTTAEPVVVEDPTAAPVVVEDPTAAPVVVEDPTAEPVVVEDPTAEPVVVEDPTAEPVVVEDPTAEPVVVEDPTAEPVVVEDPTAEPVVEDPTAEPIVEEPTEAPAYIRNGYAKVVTGGHVYRRAAHTGYIVRLAIDQVVLVTGVYEEEGRYEVRFDTEVGSFAGYVDIDNLVAISKQSGASSAMNPDEDKIPTYNGYKLPYSNCDTQYLVLATETPDETEEPTETPSVVEEPTEAPDETEEPTEITGAVEEPTEEEPTDAPEQIEQPTPPLVFEVEEDVPTKEPVVEEPTEAPEQKEEAAQKPEADKDEDDKYIVVGEIGADIRLEGDGLSEIIQTIPEGTSLTVLGVEGDWVKVDINGVIGYIYIDSVSGIELPEPTEPTEPALDEDEEPMANFKITIFSSRRSMMAPGETVYLTSKIEGFDGYEVMYQWQCDKGNGFEDVPESNIDTYTFEASVETLAYDWQLQVYYR